MKEISEFDKCRDFLDKLVVNYSHAELAIQLWEELQDKIDNLLIPAIVIGTYNSILLCWSTNNYYSEIEVYADETFDWFCRDRQTGKFYGSDNGVSSIKPIANKFIEILRYAVIELK